MIRKKVIVIGAGFGGLQAVKKLSKDPQLDITLIDKTNHHLFQPLLYQVSSAVLSAPDIAIPARHLTADKKNVDVIMGEVTDIDLQNRLIHLEDLKLRYDYLILAMGAQTGYFGNLSWKENSFPLKNLDDALRIRNKLLLAFEQSEVHPNKAGELLSFVIVGGGPTGVELAGAFAELSHKIIKREYRKIDTSKTKITLIEAGPDLVPTFDRELSAYTKTELIKRGVNVLTDTKVSDVFKNGVLVKNLKGIERKIEAEFVIWAAGVEANSITKSLGIPVDRTGRIKVNQNCMIEGYPGVFAIGDIADFTGEDGRPLPGVSPVAMQQGRYVADFIKKEINGKSTQPFRYTDKGSMATIGRNTAIAQKGKLKFKGTLGWLGWLFIHLFYQVGFKNKVSILITWIWSYITFGASARVIINPKK